MSDDLLGAKLVGRYRSGAPLEGANNDPADPSVADPTVLDDDHINAFEYSSDPDGTQVPRAAHIRKVYPRDQDNPGEDEAERHRIMRRGIPFGHSFHRGGRPGSVYAPDATFPQDRGLCFVCYQRSILDQFEFIQDTWVNRDSFPVGGDGVDPIISQATEPRSMALPGGKVDPLGLAKQWVKTTGGEYFLAPSISALKERRIRTFVSFGTQVSLFSELHGLEGADHLVKTEIPPNVLPVDLGRWLNVWHQLDPLAFVMRRSLQLSVNGQVGAVQDFRLQLVGLPTRRADLSFHSSYWKDRRFLRWLASELNSATSKEVNA